MPTSARYILKLSLVLYTLSGIRGSTVLKHWIAKADSHNQSMELANFRAEPPRATAEYLNFLFSRASCSGNERYPLTSKHVATFQGVDFEKSATFHRVGLF